jgi:hypothetical protein
MSSVFQSAFLRPLGAPGRLPVFSLAAIQSASDGFTHPRSFPMPITDEFVKSLPAIYRDLLAAFPRFDATRKVGSGLAYQSL